MRKFTERAYETVLWDSSPRSRILRPSTFESVISSNAECKVREIAKTSTLVAACCGRFKASAVVHRLKRR